MDPLGYFLRATPGFKGRGRLTEYWLRQSRSGLRSRTLPGGAAIECDMAMPYEAMVWLGREEEQDLAALRCVLRAGETFVDCGANIGLWTLVAATAVGKAGHVFAFEPNPSTFARLSEHVRANGMESFVTPTCAACGAVAGNLPFVFSGEHNQSHLAQAGEGGAAPVPVMTLDAAIANQPVHGIKIDVEGGEREVLAGAKEILQRSRPWVCVEFNASLAGTGRLGDWEVHRFLTGLGYGCRPMEEAGRGDGDGKLHDDWSLQGYRNLFYSPR